MRAINERTGERLYYVVGFRDWNKEDCCFAMHDIEERDLVWNIESNVRLSGAIIFEITPQSSYPK